MAARRLCTGIFHRAECRSARSSRRTLCYFQGGLTWYHAKAWHFMSLQKMVDAGIVAL
ncbi:MAG: hypothetical protein ACLUD2_15150 [Clostridium sp.]